MPFELQCRCGNRFAAPDQYAGRRVKCPRCGEPVEVPAATAAAVARTAPVVVAPPARNVGRTVVRVLLMVMAGLFTLMLAARFALNVLAGDPPPPDLARTIVETGAVLGIAICLAGLASSSR